jgi:hypothetical protein
LVEIFYLPKFGYFEKIGVFQQPRDISPIENGMVFNLDMNRVITHLILIVLVLTPSMGQTDKGKPKDTQPHSTPNVPRTVDEAVLILKTKWLSAKNLDWLLRNPQKQAVATLYRPFGTGVRNQFGLWGENQQLRDSCGVNDPEGCSVVIFNRLWESVRSDADPALVRQLDCQFQLTEAIQINYKGFRNLTTGELIKRLQSQIDAQMATFEARGQSPCQNALDIVVEGKPDKHCFMDASFAKPRKGQPKDQPMETSLEMILGWLGVRNFFMARHVPPQVVLNFTRQCHFPNPPPSY